MFPPPPHDAFNENIDQHRSSKQHKHTPKTPQQSTSEKGNWGRDKSAQQKYPKCNSPRSPPAMGRSRVLLHCTIEFGSRRSHNQHLGYVDRLWSILTSSLFDFLVTESRTFRGRENYIADLAFSSFFGRFSFCKIENYQAIHVYVHENVLTENLKNNIIIYTRLFRIVDPPIPEWDLLFCLYIVIKFYVRKSVFLKFFCSTKASQEKGRHAVCIYF